MKKEYLIKIVFCESQDEEYLQELAEGDDIESIEIIK